MHNNVRETSQIRLKVPGGADLLVVIDSSNNYQVATTLLILLFPAEKHRHTNKKHRVYLAPRTTKTVCPRRKTCRPCPNGSSGKQSGCRDLQPRTRIDPFWLRQASTLQATRCSKDKAFIPLVKQGKYRKDVKAETSNYPYNQRKTHTMAKTHTMINAASLAHCAGLSTMGTPK